MGGEEGNGRGGEEGLAQRGEQCASIATPIPTTSLSSFTITSSVRWM